MESIALSPRIVLKWCRSETPMCFTMQGKKLAVFVFCSAGEAGQADAQEQEMEGGERKEGTGVEERRGRR
jgi:hypothetical protein